MAKSKRGPSLFEMLETAESVPRSVRQASPASVRRKSVSKRAADGGASLVPQAASDDDGESVVAFDGDRLRFSFTSGTAAIAIFCAVGLLAGAYWLGSAYGRKTGLREGFELGQSQFAADVADEIEAARQRDPATDLIGNIAEGGANQGSAEEGSQLAERGLPPANSGAGVATTWVRGLTYIAVQEFEARNADHADAAQQFLAQRGVETAKIPLETGGVQLVTKQGYNRRDATQRRMADQLKEKIHNIGKDYFAAGGGYRLEGYFKTLTRDEW